MGRVVRPIAVIYLQDEIGAVMPLSAGGGIGHLEVKTGVLDIGSNDVTDRVLDRLAEAKLPVAVADGPAMSKRLSIHQ
jgi:hypothetical protein